MMENKLFEFMVDNSTNSIMIKRLFAAQLPIVWDAFTKKELLDQWWAPQPWKCRTKSMNFSDGGKWLYAMIGPNGEEHWAIATYSNIKPRKSFSGDDAFSDIDGNINMQLPQSKWDVSFFAKGDVTLVELKISYANSDHMETTLKMGFQEGISMALENMDELLDGA